jgi:hypothetical protein
MRCCKSAGLGEIPMAKKGGYWSTPLRFGCRHHLGYDSPRLKALSLLAISFPIHIM